MNLKVAVISNLIYAVRYAGAEVDAEDNIAVAGIRFKLVVELNI